MIRRLAPLLLVLGAVLPASAQEAPPEPAAVPEAAAPATGAGRCGTRPVAIARMQWPSAAILAEIHARLLATHYGCTTQVLPGDMGATGASMVASGQPAVAPELWVGRIAESWNAGLADARVRAAGPAYDPSVFEGWFVPAYLARARPALLTAGAIAANLDAFTSAPPTTLAPEPTSEPAPAGEEERPVSDALPMMPLPAGQRPRFISCPPDWACALINRNLLAAHGLAGQVELIEPANRFEMDTLIAEAVSRREPVLFYYWQPNAVLSQFDFRLVDMGAFDAEALNCLARRDCAEPRPTSFAPEDVVVALGEWVFVEAPEIAGYFGRATMPVVVMNDLMSALSEPGMTPEAVAEDFVAERPDIWETWVGLP